MRHVTARCSPRRLQVVILTLAIVVSGLAWGALLPQAPDRPPTHLLSIEDVLATSEVSGVTMSPDGEHVAVVVRRSRSIGSERYGWNYTMGDDRADIWLIPRLNGQPRNLTRGGLDGTGHWRPVWSPDGRMFVFLSTRGGDNVYLFVFDLDRNRAWRLSERGIQLHASVGVYGPPMSWVTPTRVLVGLMPKGQQPFAWVTGNPPRRRRIDSLWKVAEGGRTPSVSVLDAGIEISESDRPQGQVAVIDVRTNQTSVLGDANVRSVFLSPDRAHAAIFADAGRKPRPAGAIARLPTDVSTGNYLRFGVQSRLGIASTTSDGTINWLTNLDEPRPDAFVEPWVAGGALAVLTGPVERPDTAVIDLRGHLIGKTLPASADSNAPRDTSETMTVSPYLAGLLPLPTGRQLRARSALTGFEVQTAEPPWGSEIWTSDGSGALPRIRLRLNEHLARVNDDVGTDSAFMYTARNRSAQTARILLPPGGQPTGGYPLVVWVYPGFVIPDSVRMGPALKPRSSVLAFLDIHLLAMHGWAVLIPSIPHSEGNPRRDIAGFVLPAIDSLARRGVIDSLRLAILGHSHGGLATYWLLTSTDRFAAAIVINAPPDIVHRYGSFIASYVEAPAPEEWATDGMYAFEDTGGTLIGKPAVRRGRSGVWLGLTPWDDTKRWVSNNPLYHFDRISTPVMIVHGDNDVFYMGNADVAFQSLRRLGKRTKYLRYWGETHSIQSPANIRNLWQHIYAWLDACAGPVVRSQ